RIAARAPCVSRRIPRSRRADRPRRERESPVVTLLRARASIRWPRAAAFVAVALFARCPAALADSARLDAALKDHLAAGSQSIDVIVHGSRSEVQALATAYNLVVRKQGRSIGVVRVTAGQLAAMRDDGLQDHYSIDLRIHS